MTDDNFKIWGNVSQGIADKLNEWALDQIVSEYGTSQEEAEEAFLLSLTQEYGEPEVVQCVLVEVNTFNELVAIRDERNRLLQLLERHEPLLTKLVDYLDERADRAQDDYEFKVPTVLGDEVYSFRRRVNKLLNGSKEGETRE